MRVLLDTQALILWVHRSTALPRTARAAITDPLNEVLVSVASLWEATIKRALGKLDFPDDAEVLMRDEGFVLLQITLPHLAWLGHLPLHHRDPFDRLLAAQALSEGVRMITGDRRIGRYGVRVLW
jgi:PIN domain nuclease of toxin-antitoxin system